MSATSGSLLGVTTRRIGASSRTSPPTCYCSITIPHPWIRSGYLLILRLVMHFTVVTWIDGCDVASNTAPKCSRLLSTLHLPSLFLIWEKPLAASKGLHLQCMYLDNQFAELLFSGCPVLEGLELMWCNLDFQEIKSRTLKKLVLDNCDHLNGGQVVIAAPRLAFLQLSIRRGCCSNGISICETASLVEAWIYLHCLGETFYLKHQRRLLGNLCNVPNLELFGFQTMAMLVEESVEFPIFTNLQTLSLERCFLDKCDLSDKLEALGSFVQNAPCLEKLTLYRCMFEVEMGTEGQPVRKNIMLRRQDENTYRCPKLKCIEVIYEDHDQQLVELLWGIGRKLPDASILLTNFYVD